MKNRFNIPKLPTCSNFEKLHHLHRIPHLPSPQRWHSGRRCCHLQIAGMVQGLFLPGDSFGSSLVGNSLALNHRVPITFIIVVFFIGYSYSTIFYHHYFLVKGVSSLSKPCVPIILGQNHWTLRKVGCFTLWLCQQFAIENGHRNSEFSHEKW